MIRRGHIPHGMLDPGGRRKRWTDQQVQETLRRLLKGEESKAAT